MTTDETLRALWAKLTYNPFHDDAEEYPAHAPKLVLERYQQNEEEWTQRVRDLRTRHRTERLRYNALANPVRRALNALKTGLEAADTGISCAVPASVLREDFTGAHATVTFFADDMLRKRSAPEGNHTPEARTVCVDGEPVVTLADDGPPAPDGDTGSEPGAGEENDHE
jgi:hypothetical protein